MWEKQKVVTDLETRSWKCDMAIKTYAQENYGKTTTYK